MNFNRILPIVAIAAASCTTALAQDNIDALRFSFFQPQGTARSMGFGNALGSIGGDFTSLSVNPAGIGIYRKSEMMITPGLSLNNVNSSYLGNQSDDNGTRFQVSNIGFISSKAATGKNYAKNSWKAVSYGVGMNRTADFSRDYNYGGLNNTTSASYAFEEYGARFDGTDNAQQNMGSLEYLGYQTYLTNADTVFGVPGYFSPLNVGVDPVQQFTSVKEKGGVSEMVISLGGNYQEKLMLGGTIGIPVLRFEREKSLSEYTNDTASIDLKSFTYNEKLRTSGTGVNLKFGAIYKPIESLRLGLAIHSPTWYSLTDQSNISLTTTTLSQGEVSIGANERSFDYRLRTPWKAVASAAGMLGKNGFVTVDYEYVDYQSMRYSFDNNFGAYEAQRNNDIRNAFKAASNIRAGLEVRLADFMLRGGFGFYGSPYESSVKEAQRYVISGGLGWRFENGFIDLAYQHTTYEGAEQPYTLNQNYYGTTPVPTAALKTNQGRIAATLGLKF